MRHTTNGCGMNNQTDRSLERVIDPATVCVANARGERSVTARLQGSVSQKAVGPLEPALAASNGPAKTRASADQGCEAYTIGAVCKKTSLGRTSIYAAIKNGQLVARKHGRRTIVLADDLHDFLQLLPQHRPETPNSDAY